jgi:hypothetical protein
MNIVMLRFFVYGDGQKWIMLIPRLVCNIRERHPISLQGDKLILLNLVHVSNAFATVVAELKLRGLHKINVAGSEVLAPKRISEIIRDKVGVKPIFKYDRHNVPGHLVGNINNMKKYLITPLCFPSNSFNNVIDIKNTDQKSMTQKIQKVLKTIRINI